MNDESKLSDELVELFFDNIKTIQELSRASQVCQQWQRIGDSNRQWNKFLDEENRVPETESAKTKLFAIKKFASENNISLKVAERRLALKTALQNATPQQKVNLTDESAVKLYENGHISLPFLKALDPMQRYKITHANILHLIETNYISADYVLTCDVDSDIPTLNNAALNPLRESNVLDPSKEKDLTSTQRDHFEDKRLHKRLIEGIINVDYVKTLTIAERQALAEEYERQDQQINFSYGT